jgi:hypothetical protein
LTANGAFTFVEDQRRAKSRAPDSGAAHHRLATLAVLMMVSATDRRMPGMQVSVRSTIVSVFEKVASEHNQKLAPLSDQLPLMQSGLDSLCFAIVVARLEDQLGYDPFAATEEATFPVTFGDFIKFYEDAAT